jgi:hypothetical protein
MKLWSEHTLGKGEVLSSILSGSTTFPAEILGFLGVTEVQLRPPDAERGVNLTAGHGESWGNPFDV